VHCFILELRLIVLIDQLRVKIGLQLHKVASCLQHRNNASKSKRIETRAAKIIKQ